GRPGAKFDRVVHAHRQHVAARLALPAHRERLRTEARAAAGFAGHFYLRQEAHLDLLDSLAFAGLAAPALGVERKAAGAPAAHSRFVRLGEQAPDRVPEADIGGRARARRLADRRLIDFEHAAEGFRPVDRAAARWRRGPVLSALAHHS